MDKKTVYAISDNGELIGEHECQPDPLGGGWLYPSYYTEIVPPDRKKNKKLKFNKSNKSWDESDDFTGAFIYNKLTRLQTLCESAEIPEGFTLEAPATEFDDWDEKKKKWFINKEKEEQHKWELIRSERNALLSECDWTQLPDNALSEAEKEIFAKYRQDLRDIPQNFKSADKVIWPKKI